MDLLNYFRSSEAALLCESNFFKQSPNQRIQLMKKLNAEKLRKEEAEAQRKAETELLKKKERENAKRIRELESARLELEQGAAKKTKKEPHSYTSNTTIKATCVTKKHELKVAKKEHSAAGHDADNFAKQKELAKFNYLSDYVQQKAKELYPEKNPPLESCAYNSYYCDTSSLDTAAEPTSGNKAPTSPFSTASNIEDELRRQIEELKQVQNTMLRTSSLCSYHVMHYNTCYVCCI